MHLRAIKLRGFKSFPEPVEIRLEPGVAVIVGPNGSGKSNVADAIVWAAGSLSPSELRAERADDVLFAGSQDRPAAGWCEVELLFDNSDGGFDSLDFAEVSIARRLHRGGEGQYLVNRSPVRRLDVVELLADVGLSGGMHSVVGQGRVEAVLASRPQDRRELVEEAAGLGRFKVRRHRAELKLARVATQVERARDLEQEVRTRLRPLALQATAAERAERVAGELAALEARLARLDLDALAEQLSEVEEARAGAALERGRAERRLQGLLAERARAEEELGDAAGRREGALSALYRLRSAIERLTLRHETAREFLDHLRSELAAAGSQASSGEPSRDELERRADEARSAARVTEHERESRESDARLARERLVALERALAELEGLPPAARALSEAGQSLALSLLRVDEGYERAVAAALGWRGAAVLAPSAQAGLALVEQARDRGLGDLVVLVPPPAAHPAGVAPGDGAEPLLASVQAHPGGEALLELLRDVWVVEGRLLTRLESGTAVTRDGCGYAPASGELWYAGEAAEAILLGLAARREQLAAEVSELTARAETARGDAAAASAAADKAAELLASAGGRRSRPALDPRALRPIAGAAERLAGILSGVVALAERLEAPLRARVDAGAVKVGKLGGELRRLGGEEVELRRAASQAAERAVTIEAERARLGAEAAEARRRLEAAAAEPAPGDDRDELEIKRERLARRLEALGRVNPLAKEEYEREKERLDELAAQRGDLERTLEELERLRAELAETVDRRFAETFAAVQAHFEEVSSTLFPGGGGRLRLTEPDEEEAEPGVEVELRPAGKRVTKLSLLSGGEKALGAISFLFALFLARPSPFYLLDEVEAALDDPNISRFVELLRRYADRAQFIVVTHQKRTMQAADILYGVTMGTDGVSKILSRRMAAQPVALASA